MHSTTSVTHAELAGEAKQLAVLLSDAEIKENLITVFETHGAFSGALA